MLRGSLPYRLKDLHDRYGSVVRIGPNELSYIEPAAWRDIYTSRSFIRPKQWGQRPPGVEAHNLISAPPMDHARFRKALGPAFSEKAVKAQEPTITLYVELLIHSLRRMIEDSPNEDSVVVNMVEWLGYTTFDIIGDLGWGNSFNCLRNKGYHPWTLVAMQYKALLYAVVINYYPVLAGLISWITPQSALAGLDLVKSVGASNVRACLERGSDGRDFMSCMMAHNTASPSASLSEQEMAATSTNLIIGGSDPVATTLAGALNHLLHDPESMDRLVDEIRRGFHSASDISASTTRLLPYLTAVIQESLRLCPPTPDSMRRAVPSGGAFIAGHQLPETTVVGVSCYAAFRSDQNFSDPDAFRPDRWLEPSHALHGSHGSQVFQPFSVGPRSCPGQLLAWVEMRVILAQLLWNFNIDLAPGAALPKWTSQRIYWAWNREPMNVRLRNARGKGASQGICGKD
ncbi:MAG: hypothetical protein Q9202_001909 [Teloschistes flavicans]